MTDDVLFHVTIPMPAHVSKKNGKEISFNRSTGRRFVRSNDRVLLAQKWLIQKLTTERLKQKIDTITEDIIAEFVFWFPESIYYTKKGERSLKINYLSNLIELPQDCLQTAKIIENDAKVVSLGNSHRRPIKGNQYYLEIKLSRPKESYFSKLVV